MNGDEQAIEIPPATPRVTAMLPCETGADRMKVCRSCGQEKPVNAFWKKSRYEYQSQCIECMSEQRRIAREKGGLPAKRAKGGRYPMVREPPPTPDYAPKTGRYPRTPRLNTSSYQVLFEAQDGDCAVCGNPEATRGGDGKVLPLAFYYGGQAGEVRG